MIRDLTTDMLNELDKSVVSPVILGEFDFESGYERLWTGVGQLLYDSDGDNVGEVFEGVGEFLGIGTITETRELRAEKVDISLSGIPSDLVDLAQGEGYQYRDATLWLGFLDDQKQLIDEPYVLYNGEMDVMVINDDGETASISVTCENDLIRFQTPVEVRYTDQQQKEFFPNDRGLEYVGELQDKKESWGKGI
jgi:hypothetical protein